MILITSEAKSEFDQTLFRCVDVVHRLSCCERNGLRLQHVWKCLNLLFSLFYVCDQYDMRCREEEEVIVLLLNKGKQSLTGLINRLRKKVLTLSYHNSGCKSPVSSQYSIILSLWTTIRYLLI